MLVETMGRVCESDPVWGDWCIIGDEMMVWVDTSSMGTGVAFGVNRSIVEDACWLHLTNDARQIKLAKLDAEI